MQMMALDRECLMIVYQNLNGEEQNKYEDFQKRMHLNYQNNDMYRFIKGLIKLNRLLFT